MPGRCKDNNYDKNIYICEINTDYVNKMNFKNRHMLLWSAIAMLIMIVSSCSPDWTGEMMPDYSSGNNGRDPEREVVEYTRKVMVLYSAGFNSISSYLKEDIEDLSQGWVPKKRKADDVILVYSHLPKKRGQYSQPTSPVLFQLYADAEGNIVRDTLVTYEAGTISASAGQLHEVLSYVRDTYPARSYGLIFSSHATGYLPGGFYTKPYDYTFNESGESGMFSAGMGGRYIPSPVPYVEPERDPRLPAVKSIGQDALDGMSYEIGLRDFAKAIPMKLDYILFDACLMGGVEVAYELAGKCDMVGFSQAEVLAEGFNYKTLANHLLCNKPKSSPYDVCHDYFVQYDNQFGEYRSATISLIDCNRLETLAEVCKGLFAEYSATIADMSDKGVQQFYTGSHHWFYDLKSILLNAGMTAEEEAELDAALAECVVYKGNTPSFLNTFAIHTFSGFSMYLPGNGNKELDKYYRTLKWNKATGLVK